MKITEIKKKFKSAKRLLAEYSMLEALILGMIKAKKEYPEELSFDEEYFENITKRIDVVKKELENLFT
jgi:hypothetical protein